MQKNAGGRRSKQYKITFGQFPDLDPLKAKDKAHMLIAEIRNGIDISARAARLRELRAAEVTSKTFNEVFQLYYKCKAKPGPYWDWAKQTGASILDVTKQIEKLQPIKPTVHMSEIAEELDEEDEANYYNGQAPNPA